MEKEEKMPEINPGRPLACNKCNHKWLSRSVKLPDCCPRCKSYMWDAKIKLNQEVKDEH